MRDRQENIKRQREWIANIRKAAEEVNEKWIDKVRESNTNPAMNAGVADFINIGVAHSHITLILSRFKGDDAIPRDTNRAKHTQARDEIQKYLNDLEAFLPDD